MKDEKNPNEAYSILRDNDLRDQMIIQDIKDCIQKIVRLWFCLNM